MSENILCDFVGRTILGIDPGTGRCGWAVIRQSSVVSRQMKLRQTTGDKRQTSLLDCGLIETPAKTPLADRLKIIFEKITELIKKYHPTEMAIEELFFVKNVKTGISVAHARGVIMLAGELANIPVFEYKPNEIKLAIAGHGHADKAQMLKMVKLHLKSCNVQQDDVVDAIAIGLCHLQINPIFDHANSRESGRESARELGKDLVYPELSYQIVGALYKGFNKIGAGLPERYYQASVKEEFYREKILFKEQLKVEIMGLASAKGRFFLDFVVDNKIVVELKVGTRFKKENIDQVMTYLRQSGLKLAILARFGQNGVVTQRLLLGSNSRID